MRQTRKIMILSAGYGNGHMEVSKALMHKFQHYGAFVRLVDLFQEAHPVINSITKFLYTKSTVLSVYGLDYYGWSYYMTRDMDHDSMLAKWLNSFGLRTLLSLIRKEQPDAILSTFPFGGISDVLRKYAIRIPTFTVITDFALHNRWLYTYADEYYVATHDLKQEMMKRGVPESRIQVSGIPIRESFYHIAKPQEEQKSVLIMAGTNGILRDIKRAVERLRGEKDVQIYIVCGKNDRLKAELNASFGGDVHVNIFGYVEHVHELMARSSLIVTKAGGITLSEAIQAGLPIIIYKPFPGQEKENAIYLADKGAANIANNVGELTKQIMDILTSQGTRDAMLERVRNLKTGHAAETIVQRIFNIIDQNRKSGVS